MLQWGRDIAVADRRSALDVADEVLTSKLQWGRDIAVADRLCYPAPRIGRLVHWLQWGRDIAVADRGRSPTRSALALRASMGPRHRCRGSFAFPSAPAAVPRFNGAATSLSRIARRQRAGYVNEHRLNGAATSLSRIVCRMSRPCCAHGFNGAATSLSRIARLRGSRGRVPITCFNGAATSLSRIVGRRC